MGEKLRKTNLEERTKERGGHSLENREPMANKRQSKRATSAVRKTYQVLRENILYFPRL